MRLAFADRGRDRDASVVLVPGGHAAPSAAATARLVRRDPDEEHGARERPHDCPMNGLVVGANGITIDLNGHTIDGTNARTPGTGGIANDGHSNVTIENGTISDFYYLRRRSRAAQRGNAS